MKKTTLLLSCAMMFLGVLLLSGFKKEKRFSIVENKAEKRIDILINGKLFTSYIYPDELMKPVLYPLETSTGSLVTRGWPLKPRAGERVDHPHHVGLWFNYGDVNGLDFWNNSTAIAADRKHKYGTIKHIEVRKIYADDNKAELEVRKHWQKPDGSTLIVEDAKYIFREDGGKRSIELTTKLTALKEAIAFKDNKEGLIGIRVARELEHPTDVPDWYIDANGKVAKPAIANNDGVTGSYRSSEGIEGEKAWGTRNKWINLRGKIGNELVSLVIIDHPNNVGYPAYWHARGYGLFAANNLGQKEFSEVREVLDYKLPAGKSVVFKHKVLINAGAHLSDEQVNKEFNQFK